MNQILTLREKRGTLWDTAKAFLDTHRSDKGFVSPEDTATYEKMEADVVALGKEIDRLDRQADLDREMNQPLNTPITHRPDVPHKDKQSRASDEYRTAFWNQLRNRTSPEIRNTLSIGGDSEGGHLCPDEYERTLVDKLRDENVLRGLCRIIRTSSGDRKIPLVAARGAAAWVEEGMPIPESDDAFGQISVGAYKVATIIKCSDELLNDSVFNIEAYIADEFSRRVGEAEEQAFINGNGIGKPTGLLHDTLGAETGVTTASGTAITADEIIDLVYSLRGVYRKRAVLLLNDTTVKSIRKLKDSQGQVRPDRALCKVA